MRRRGLVLKSGVGGGGIECSGWQDPKGLIFLERPLIHLHAKMAKRWGGGTNNIMSPPPQTVGGGHAPPPETRPLMRRRVQARIQRGVRTHPPFRRNLLWKLYKNLASGGLRPPDPLPTWCGPPPLFRNFCPRS